MVLPADSHVHSEWSWDAPWGDMVATCVRAVALGLPALAFTEHLDHTRWRVALEGLPSDHLLVGLSDDGGELVPPALDVASYLEGVAECRDRFPRLRILSGLELGEPHRHPEQVARVLAAGAFDRVLGSVHSVPTANGYAEPPGLLEDRGADEVVRLYLDEVDSLLAHGGAFEVLAHLDYPVRTWPADAAPFDPQVHESQFRHVLRRLADSGRALEVSTVVPFHASLLNWWREEGGEAITFGSDAHDPASVAQGFEAAAALARAHGFEPGRRAHDLWGRRR